MTLIDWLRRKLNSSPPIRPQARQNRINRRNHYRRHKRETVNVDPGSDSIQSADSRQNKEVQPAPADHQVKEPQPVDQAPAKTDFSYESRQQSQISIFYLDENQHEIRPADILNGFSGDRLHFRFPTFADYFITAIDNFTSYFEDDDQEITVHYELRQGQPVLIYSVDTDTGNILQSVNILSDKLGKKYRIDCPNVANYRLITSTGNTLGHFNTDIQKVIFAYRRADWKTVQQVEYYVKLTRHHDVFDEPNGHILRTGLPKNLVLKVFGSVITSNGTSWLNIGGFEWIKNHLLEPSDPPVQEVAGPITETSRNPVRLFGTISFVPGRSVAVFDQPYGTQTNELLDGSRVSIVATIVDDQNLIWYELADHSVIPRNYVAVDE